MKMVKGMHQRPKCSNCQLEKDRSSNSFVNRV